MGLNLTDRINRIDSFAEMEAGWDGYRAPAISSDAIRNAKRLLVGLSNPLIAPMGDGGVMIEFDDELGGMIAVVSPDGSLSAEFVDD